MRSFQSRILRGLLLALVLGFFALGPILSFPAGPPVTAELVVVLGGGGGPARFAMGLELAGSGIAPKLLLIHPEPDQLKMAKEAPGLDRVSVFSDDFSVNSWDEAVSTRAWMEARGVKRVLVVSDPPHMLRLSYAWSRVFAGSGLSFSLVSSRPPWWSAWRWWANENSRHFVGNEVLKLAYYIWHY